MPINVVQREDMEVAEHRIVRRGVIKSSIDGNFLHMHMQQCEYVRARLNDKLTAQEMVDGVRITHDDYLRLVTLARNGIEGANDG